MLALKAALPIGLIALCILGVLGLAPVYAAPDQPADHPVERPGYDR